MSAITSLVKGFRSLRDGLRPPLTSEPLRALLGRLRQAGPARAGRAQPTAARVDPRKRQETRNTTPGKPRIDWDDPQAKDDLVSALVNDALALVDALAPDEITAEA